MSVPQYSMTADTLVVPRVVEDPVSDPETVVYARILKLVPSSENLELLQSMREAIINDEAPKNAGAVPIEDRHLHVTLVHARLLKPYREKLKALSAAGKLPVPPKAVLKKEWVIKIGEGDQLGRKSWAVELVNQEVMQGYVNQVMGLIGGQPNPEPNRVFHITLANLTGNLGDSVR